MANYLINLISEISGFANFQKCLEICDIVDFNGLLSIDENTLDRMEIFLQKKCSRMSLNERNIFLGDRFVKNPGIFKFSPATRQRIVNVIKNLEKIFTNPLLPINISSISELCNKLSTNHTAAISSIPVNSIEVVLKQNYLVNPFESNVSLSSITNPNDGVSQSDISETKSLSESTKNGTKIDYSNIFQKMDSLRENFTKLSEKPDTSDEDSQAATKEIFPFQNTEISDSDINKENISQKSAIKRPVDIDSEKDEPAKKIKRVSNRLLNELSSQPEKMLPERLRSQRLINKTKMNKTTELLTIKYDSKETDISHNISTNLSGEIQDYGQTSSDNRSTSESNTVINMKQKDNFQHRSNLSESDKPDLLNNLPQPSNSFDDSDKVLDKVKQKSRKTHKSHKYSPKISHFSDAMVSDSVKISNISKQLSKFKETIINASGAKHPNWPNTGNVISSTGSKGTVSTSSQFFHQTFNGVHKPLKTPTNPNHLDKTLKDKQQKFHKSPDTILNDRKPSNTSKHLNRCAEELTAPSEFDVVSITKVTKIGERDDTNNSFSQFQVITNSIPKFIGRTWQPPKTSPLYKEVAKLESHVTVSHPISGQSTSVISKSPPSQNIQIYIEPDLPKPNIPQRVQLSDVPFQCFDSPALSKKPSCIRIKRPVHSSKISSNKPPSLSATKLAPCRFQSDIDADPSSESSVNNVNSVAIAKNTEVKPIVTNQVSIQQKTTPKMMPKESETNLVLIEKSSVTHNPINNGQVNVTEKQKMMFINSVAKVSETNQESIENSSVTGTSINNNQVNVTEKQEMMAIDSIAKESETNQILIEKSTIKCTSINNDQENVRNATEKQKVMSSDPISMDLQTNQKSLEKSSVISTCINSDQVNMTEKQKMMPIDQIAKESEANQESIEMSSVTSTSINDDQINVKCGIENSNSHISQSITMTHSIKNGATKEVSDPEKESSNNKTPFTPEPSWISKPSFITNRFINSTKHIRAVLANGIKAESRLPTESEHPTNA